jgi:hypothetical protein
MIKGNRRILQQSPAMMQQWADLLDKQGQLQFRRSELADRLYPLTNPRSRTRADAHADAIIRRAASAGDIVRIGHVHWRAVQTTRTLRSGRKVALQEELVTLTLKTHAPRKWASVDLETGEVWIGSEAGWRRATAEAHDEVREVLKAPK